MSCDQIEDRIQDALKKKDWSIFFNAISAQKRPLKNEEKYSFFNDMLSRGFLVTANNLAKAYFDRELTDEEIEQSKRTILTESKREKLTQKTSETGKSLHELSHKDIADALCNPDESDKEWRQLLKELKRRKIDFLKLSPKKA